MGQVLIKSYTKQYFKKCILNIALIKKPFFLKKRIRQGAVGQGKLSLVPGPSSNGPHTSFYFFKKSW